MLRIVRVVAECLNVADDLSFHGQDPFEGRRRIHATVIIDGQDALAQIERGRRVTPQPKGIAGDGYCAYEALQAAAVILSVGRKAEGTVG